MTGKDYHPAETNGYTRSDHEAGSHHTKELKRKKRMKILLYVVIFAVFQTAVVTLFALTIMKFRTPKFRVTSAGIETLNSSTSSFNATMGVELSVKNTNFGHFRYRDTTIDFYHGEIMVGQASVPRGRAKWRSTRRFDVIVDLSANNIASNSQLANDIRDGVLPLRAQSRVRGRITIMFIMKKNKSANLNCNMMLLTQTRQIQNLVCN
ncbi:hypothetical protein LguiA_031871 [Lonicera macranthoides]